MAPGAHREFHRPARVHPAPVESGELRVASPPTVPPPPGNAVVQVALPVLGSMGMVGFAVVLGEARFLVMAGAMAGALLLSGALARFARTRATRRDRRDRHRRYLEHVDDLERRLASAALARRHRDAVATPPSTHLWSVVANGRRVWERRTDDGDFGFVRVGIGRVPSPLRAVYEQPVDPTTALEPDLVETAHRLVDRHRHVEGAAVTIDIRAHGCIAVVGDLGRARDLARSMLVQLAVWCAPDDMRMVVACRQATEASYPPGIPGDEPTEWEWAQTLPHTDIDGDLQIIAGDGEELATRLERLFRPRLDHMEKAADHSRGASRPLTPHVTVVVDDYHPRRGAGTLEVLDEALAAADHLAATVICLVGSVEAVPSAASLTIAVDSDVARMTAAGPTARGLPAARLEPAPLQLCRAVADALSPLRLRTRTGRATSIESPGLMELLGLHTGEERLFPAEPCGTLRTPIGVGEDGSALVLDLAEAAAGGMGPHGMLIGATGSGKSELLRSLVLGLASRHPPSELAFVLIDYKGGATFSHIGRLPHSAGLITNLERDPLMVARMLEALHGELDRRQQLLHDAGGLDCADDYRSRQREDPGLEPLPTLLVMVDEFGELLGAHPDFVELFATIGRVGRSLGVHLLLSTQRMEEGRMRRLEGHLRYRLCLRTFTPEESSSVIGSKSAAELPPIPGVGYLKVDGSLTAFKAATVGRTAPGTERTEMEELLSRVDEAGWERTRQVWVEPLPACLPLGGLAGSGGAPATPGWMQAAVGIVDDPRRQLVETLSVDLADGNLAVVGAPRSGKSVLIRTLAMSLAAGHDPYHLQMYAIDLGGGGLALLEDLPHLGAVLGRSDRPQIERLTRQMTSLIERRTESFRRHRITDMAAYHQLRSVGTVEDEHGEVVVLVDNWTAVTSEIGADAVDRLAELAATGLHYGLHLVIATGRWQDIRPATRDGIGTRLELRLADPLDSEIDRGAAARVPRHMPGRGLAPDGRVMQVALPESSDAGTGSTAALVEQVRDRWLDRPPAPPLLSLPDSVGIDDLPSSNGLRLVLGLVEHGLDVWHVNLGGPDPHVVILGDAESGKTNLLRVIARQMVTGGGDLQIAAVDYRRRLAGHLPTSHLLGVATLPEEVAELAGRVRATAEARGASLHRGSRPVGPEVVLLVDDYDLVAGAGSNPLSVLLEVIPRGADLGLHVVLARRVGGVTRSAFEPVYQRIREMGTPGLVLAGDPTEGAVFGGVRAGPRPPGRGWWVDRGKITEVQAALITEGDQANVGAPVHRIDRRAG